MTASKSSRPPVVLVTGGAGYIGSHTCLALQEAGYDIVVIDDLSNSSPESLSRVEQLTGKKVLDFVHSDVRNEQALDALFQKHKPVAVIHFAGLKAVGESVRLPLMYYDANIGSTVALLNCMIKHECFNFVFSSSATVYGNPGPAGTPGGLPLRECAPLGALNPYGQTKLAIEHMLRDLACADERWRITLLRYFNPCGAHPSGRIGEDPQGIPNNLMPYVSQVAVGVLPHINVFGNDYSTPDGTGVRDYIHVCDLAAGHVSALAWLLKGCPAPADAAPGTGTCQAINLGTGVGYSVLEMIAAMEKACGRKLAYKITDRRPGDADAVYSDASLALALLGWKAELDLERMCQDLWNWQHNNPHGYAVTKGSQ
ncbi:UDP-glucose 4-epimerase [Fonticula alba]|uniref:UDP-glucose 4-epimerase n=1 Tax=Fonticula alba TaxID=691883 RepID=A0A058Z5W8_FONAL|nr:UDP-glucose 4-epimerase [Fonticula alba]KCV69665.1 UDP-glucose 4-epimerase [Fonticula alba]|eukprot:XP_009496230.1 UDP-glucose 4-epimerase [Fonticula alba]